VIRLTLREARVRAGLTQEQAARLFGVSQQTVSDYEVGRSHPSVVRARQIERLLGCAPGEIEWPEPVESDQPAASGE
jgi:DNA-binding XRE family transcriptional regulator